MERVPTEKACLRCGEVKPLDEFREVARSKYGRYSRCRLCEREVARLKYAQPGRAEAGAARLKAWRKANPEKYKAQGKRSTAVRAARDERAPQRKRDRSAYMKDYWKRTDKKPTYDRAYRERHAEELRERKRQHRLDHPEEYRDADGREHTNRNPERYRRKKRERYQRDPSKVNEYNGAWAKANPERRRAYGRKWYAKNKDKAHAYWLRRRARKAARPEYVISPKDLRRIYQSPCLACGATENIQMEHLIPISNEFSTHGIGNLASLCKPCNGAKNNRLWVEWKYSGLPRAREVFGVQGRS